jgi:hypothetical protein
MRFYIRTSNSPYRWNDVPWVPINPGKDLSDAFLGRYIQIAADFYPSGNGDVSPYLAELRVIYNTVDPPPPPVQVSAAAKNGAVELSWKASPSRDVGGYLVYFGTAKGEYFEIKSPLDVGNRTSVRIDGLNNGTLYYFAIAAYGRHGAGAEDFILEPGRLALEPGEFSREVAARPLRMVE